MHIYTYIYTSCGAWELDEADFSVVGIVLGNVFGLKNCVPTGGCCVQDIKTYLRKKDIFKTMSLNRACIRYRSQLRKLVYLKAHKFHRQNADGVYSQTHSTHKPTK